MPIPPIFCTVVVTKILAPDPVVCAIAFREPSVRLAIPSIAPTEQREKASTKSGLKIPALVEEVFMICRLHWRTVLNVVPGYAEMWKL